MFTEMQGMKLNSSQKTHPAIKSLYLLMSLIKFFATRWPVHTNTSHS